MGSPELSGARHFTRSFVVLPETAETFGFAGLSGPGTSVTRTVSICFTVFARSPVPLVAMISTTNSLLLAAFAGSVLSASPGFS